MSGALSKERLINLVTPDSNITELQSKNPRLHTALKNASTGSQQLIDATFPPLPTHPFIASILSGGIQLVGPDQLQHPYQVILPIDPSGYFKCLSVTLTSCYSALKVAPASTSFVADILVSQLHGTTTFKDLFQASMSPTIPVGITTAHNTKFAINTLYEQDILRFDVSAADGVASGLEIKLLGYYNWTEN